MSELPHAGIVIFAKQLEQLAAFYQHILLLRIKISSPEKIILESAALIVVIHRVAPETAAHIVITNPPVLRQLAAMKPLFPVANLAQARLRAASLGGLIYPAENEWIAGDFRACDGFDPEGNIIQLRELNRSL